MVGYVMGHIKNYFPKKSFEGTITIEAGTISLSDIPDGAYYLVEGSLFNDGVWKKGEEALQEEVFDGAVTLLAPPKAFLDVVHEIEEWQEKNAEVISKPYQSETLTGAYSYTMKTGKNGGTLKWEDVFGSKLYQWRKL